MSDHHEEQNQADNDQQEARESSEEEVAIDLGDFGWNAFGIRLFSQPNSCPLRVDDRVVRLQEPRTKINCVGLRLELLNNCRTIIT